MMKTIEDYPNYTVSRDGKVINTKSGQVLTVCYNNRSGSGSVLLTTTDEQRRVSKRKQSKFYVHRLVAQTYIPNPDNLKIVSFIDGNPLNVSVDNLEWVSKETIHRRLQQVEGYYTNNISIRSTVVDPEGNIHKVVGINTLCKQQGLDPHTLALLTKGVFSQHKGWTLFKEESV